MCCFSQLSLLTEHLSHLIRIDPLSILPREISLKILSHLDATSLCRAAQVARKWKELADDDILWRGICEQHIGQKCRKCGWGLPILESKRGYRPSPCPSPLLRSAPLKRPLEDFSTLLSPPTKRQRAETDQANPHDHQMTSESDTLLAPTNPPPTSLTRPWKHVYSERLTIERNWRRGRCTVQTLKGHTDGVMCLQFSETLAHPAFPVLITGSYDRTVRVWNMDTGVQLHCLKGHTRAVRALQFDEVKLITGSMDHTLKVWDWRRGKCIRTLTGHTEGVVCLNFDSNVLASGSVDSTIKVWNLRTGSAFTLRGHTDWVNAVQLWDSTASNGAASPSTSLFDVSGSASPAHPPPNGALPSSRCPEMDPGKMLFSASDDGTIRLWDLNSRECVKQFTGHVGQVQSMKILLANDCDEDSTPSSDMDVDGPALMYDASAGKSSTPQGPPSPIPPFITPALVGSPVSSAGVYPQQLAALINRKKPMLISGSLDNTIKLWDIDTGKAVRTYFGHIEGVWAVASDKLRLVSGSHDRTIKVCQTLDSTVHHP